MANVVFYFQVHQPYRIKDYSFFSIGSDSNYYQSESDALNNSKILQKVSQKCYLPTNKLLLNLIKKYPEFKISFSLSGLAIEQFKETAPDVLESFQLLVDTGNVEILSETYYHSLAAIYSESEFISQVNLHKNLIKEVFNYTPKVFRNTELIYNNKIAQLAEKLGYKAILAEGVDKYLGPKSPNFVYSPKGTKSIKLLLKNYTLSDDVAFRFSNSTWPEYPLTASKYSQWIEAAGKNSDTVNLFMDYETFGEHHWKETGIFEFLEELPPNLVERNVTFMTVSEASEAFSPTSVLDISEFTSWSDKERDVSAWSENPMQQAAIKSLYQLERDVQACGDEQIVEDWRRLTTSDHFYYMSTKTMEDGTVHSYFSPNESPYDAYVNFMTILHDLRERVYTKIERN